VLPHSADTQLLLPGAQTHARGGSKGENRRRKRIGRFNSEREWRQECRAGIVGSSPGFMTPGEESVHPGFNWRRRAYVSI